MKTVLVLIAALSLVTSGAAAALVGVSGLQSGNQLTTVAADDNPALVAVDLATGFPVWYEDAAARKIQLCIDTRLEVAPGVIVNPCEYEPPAVGAPPSFPGNFGAEAIYWSATSLGSFVDSNGLSNSALLVLSLQATGANAGALFDGNQAVFSRIRIRVDVPVAGTYRITYPYGTIDQLVTIPGVRGVNLTQDFGIADAQDFLVAMRDGAVPLVNADGATIGPFLVPANAHGGTFDSADPATFAGGPISVGGTTYIALPFAPPDPLVPGIPVEVFQPVTGSPFGTNFFSIELLDPPVGFELAPGNVNPQRIQFDDFLLVGKVFDASANLAPTASDDVAGAGMNQPVQIDVVANDLDPVDVGNAHGLAPQAVALVDPARLVAPFTYLFASGLPQLTATQATSAGGSVRRVTSVPTGKTTFLYTPPPDYIGPDSFEYLVQDAGGLVSAPALVSVIVEDLTIDRADFRTRLGRWQLQGASSDTADNSVTLFAGPRAQLSSAYEVQVPAVVSDAFGGAYLRMDESLITYQLLVDPLPASQVTAAHIHLGAAGTNGPVIFNLYREAFDGPFTGPRSGSLSAVNLQLQPNDGISSFSDAVAAIRAGNAYVNLHTADYPDGEIRGQLTRPLIGIAPVADDGSWVFRGHAPVNPGGVPAVDVESANGVVRQGIPLQLR